MTEMLRTVARMFLTLTLLTGVVYPLAVTGLGAVWFPAQARGSLVLRDGVAVGSRLIGQSFREPGHFWGRPSATDTVPYNGTASAGSNWGPSNPALIAAVKTRIDALRSADSANSAPIPVDLVTASASGLDPDISPAAALYQVPRVAAARHRDPEAVRRLVRSQITPRQWGVFGEARVNVLMLNLALDRAQ